MKDIKLQNMNNGYFDWSFNDADINTVSGTEALKSAIIHCVLLLEHELEMNCYQNNGTLISRMIMPNTQVSREYISEVIKTEVLKIKTVSLCDVEIEDYGAYEVKLTINVESDKGDVIIAI